MLGEFRTFLGWVGIESDVRPAGRAELYAVERPISFEISHSAADPAPTVYDRCDDRVFEDDCWQE